MAHPQFTYKSKPNIWHTLSVNTKSKHKKWPSHSLNSKPKPNTWSSHNKNTSQSLKRSTLTVNIESLSFIYGKPIMWHSVPRYF